MCVNVQNNNKKYNSHLKYRQIDKIHKISRHKSAVKMIKNTKIIQGEVHISH